YLRITAWHKSAGALGPQNVGYATPPTPDSAQSWTVYWPVLTVAPDVCRRCHRQLRLERLDASWTEIPQSVLRPGGWSPLPPSAAGRRLLGVVALGIVRVRALGKLLQERVRFSHNIQSSLRGL